MAQDPNSDRTSDDFDPQEDFGADGVSSERNKEGGFHHTVYSSEGSRFSWDTNRDGDYVEGSAHDNPN